MSKTSKTTTKRERGQAAIMLTLATTLMFAAVGLAVDIGWAYYTHLSAHAAAESAALAAVQAALESGGSLTCGSHGVVCNTSPSACSSSPTTPPANNMDSACLYAQANGFVNSGNQSVTMQSNVGSAAPTVPGLKLSYWVSVRVSQSIPQLFSAVLGNTGLTPTARATAGIVPIYGGGCIYVLDPAAQNAMVVSGAGNVEASCGVYVDSNNSKALQVTGSGVLNATPGVIDVVGGDSGSNANINPAVTSGVPSFADPLANVQPPPVGPCDHPSQVSISGGTTTINPGVYCGGLAISGGANVTFNPGTYIMNGGGLTVSGGTTAVNGADVTFYDTGTSGTFRPVTFSGGGASTLSAPTSGPLNNILFFQDRTLGNSSVKNAISGGTTAQFTGVLYFPTTEVDYTGGSSTDSESIGIVADKVTFSGPSYLKDGLGAAGGAGTGSRVALIE